MEIIETSAKDYRAKYAGKKKRSKYNNRKVEYRGEVFDSQKELNRWKELLILQAAGEIKDLRRQVKFLLLDTIREPGRPTQRKMFYIADFVYLSKWLGSDNTGISPEIKFSLIVEDTKSEATQRNPVYRQKKKLMRAKYDITIWES